jgi:hypothetical protein
MVALKKIVHELVPSVAGSVRVATPHRASGRALRGRPSRLGLAAAGCYRAGPLQPLPSPCFVR